MAVSYSWTLLEGTVYEERLFGFSKGSDGFLYGVGWTKGNFGDDSVSSVNIWDSYLLKIGANGSVEWTKLLGSYSSVKGMSVDASQADSGHIYISGYTMGELDSEVNINSPLGGHDGFTAQYSPQGQLLWSSYFGGGNTDYGNAVITDSTSNVYTSGFINVRNSTNTESTYKNYLEKRSFNGDLLWFDVFGSDSNDHILDAGISGDGESIYVVGETMGEFDGQIVNGEYDSFVSKYDKDGNREWSRIFGGVMSDAAISVGVDANYNVYVAGRTMEAGADGNFKHVPYINAFNSEGDELWTFTLDLKIYEYAGAIEDIIIDDAASVAIFTGYAEDLANYSERVGFIGTINLADGKGVYIEEWSEEFDNAFVQEVVGSIEDGVYVAGFKYGDFNGKSTNGSSDAFVFALSSFGDKGTGRAGAITGNGNFQEGVILRAAGITGDPDGNGAVTGYQWFLNDSAISGATASTYSTTATGGGTYKVAVTYTDGQGFTATVDSPDQVVIKSNSDEIKSSVGKKLSDGQLNLKLNGKNNIKGIGNNLDNQITGNKGNNLLKGRSGDDTLIGRSGKDKLQGGVGDDIIDGGKGKDRLSGGSGADTFMASKGTDTIYGFNIQQGDLLSGFGDTSGLDISDSGKFCIVSGNGYTAKIKNIDADDLIVAMESVFV